MKRIFPLFLSLLLFASCKNPEANQTSTEITSETTETIIFKTESFHSIVNQSVVNIEITNDVPNDEIHLISTKSNLENIKKEVSNGVLIFSQTKENLSLKGNTKIIAQINSNQIKNFKIEGAGFIKSHIIQKANAIETTISGAGNLELIVNNNSITNTIEGLGNIDLKGRTSDLNAFIEGAGNLNAFDLETNKTSVSISGIGNANVTASEKLDVNISGIGNLTYKGNPKQIIKNNSGLGSISKH